MKSREELTREVEEENRALRAAGRPTFRVKNEVASRHSDEIYPMYREWYANHPMLPTIREEVLAKERDWRNNPTWVPRLLMNGAMDYELKVKEKMAVLWEQEMKQVIGKW